MKSSCRVSISRVPELMGIIVVAAIASACSGPAKEIPKSAAPSAPQISSAPAPLQSLPHQDVLTDARSVAAAQRALNQLGYNAGRPDGVIGPATHRAILAFQTDHALTEDGILTFALAGLLNTLVAQMPKIDTTTVGLGDTVIFSDGTSEVVKSEHIVTWEQGGARGVLAIRPSTSGWPSAARAGLDWATTHALDIADSSPVEWSSTGVDQHFQIFATANLSPREATFAGNAVLSCRHFELRGDSPQKHYPGIACLDAKGQWYVPHSQIRLARPATSLGPHQVTSDSGMAR
jgi:hypothetical protein